MKLKGMELRSDMKVEFRGACWFGPVAAPGLVAVLAIVLLSDVVPVASAGTPAGQTAQPTWLSVVEEGTRQASRELPESKPVGWEKPGILKAFTFGIDYTLVSDYVWRGINLSEYAGEGREKLNHQVGVSISADLEKLTGLPVGTLGASFWFEWYAGQNDAAFGGGRHHLQEVDYTLYWAHEIPAVPLDVEIGWIAYQFPFLEGDAQWTHEVYLTLNFDDTAIFGEAVLNPYVSYYLDVDDVRAGWIEIGIGHEFALSDFGLDKAPILKDLSFTPSLVLGIDHRYYDKAGFGSANATGTRLANLLYGLEATLDLNGVFGIPPRYGSLSLTGFLNFSQSFHDDNAAVQDEFFGGVKVGYEW